MYISVIITAYNRKEFLLNAINSVLNQTLDKKYYEVIVIKNFEDKNIDDFINRNNMKQILMDGTIGDFLYNGVSVGNGEILVFLDDDDLFAEDKLEVVLNRFKANNNLCYYHNDHITINDEYKQLIANVDNSIVFNLSSISINKNILNTDNLKQIKTNPDDFMYLSALESDKIIINGKEKLTYYMRHHSASNNLSDNFEGYGKFIITTSNLFLNTYIFFDSLVHTKKAIKFLNSQKTGMQIYKYIFGASEFPPNLINYIINSSGSLKYRLAFFLACLLIKVYPQSRKYISYKVWDIHSIRSN